MSEVKQVIVIRKDLQMTKGKMVAQGSHASLGVLLNMMNKKNNINGNGYTLTISVDENTPLKTWLDEIFTKICVFVNSEEELVDLYNKAIESKLPACLITDRGLTHFKGVPTKTALAIGPCLSVDVDKITGHLKLL